MGTTREWGEPPTMGTKVKVGVKQEQNRMHQEIVHWGHTYSLGPLKELTHMWNTPKDPAFGYLPHR